MRDFLRDMKSIGTSQAWRVQPSRILPIVTTAFTDIAQSCGAVSLFCSRRINIHVDSAYQRSNDEEVIEAEPPADEDPGVEAGYNERGCNGDEDGGDDPDGRASGFGVDVVRSRPAEKNLDGDGDHVARCVAPSVRRRPRGRGRRRREVVENETTTQPGRQSGEKERPGAGCPCSTRFAWECGSCAREPKTPYSPVFTSSSRGRSRGREGVRAPASPAAPLNPLRGLPASMPKLKRVLSTALQRLHDAELCKPPGGLPINGRSFMLFIRAKRCQPSRPAIAAPGSIRRARQLLFLWSPLTNFSAQCHSRRLAAEVCPARGSSVGVTNATDATRGGEISTTGASRSS